MKKNLLLIGCLLNTLIGISQTVTDIDGNTYNTVTIGTQVWMAENLNTTRYNDGDSIPEIKNKTAWQSDTNGALCYYQWDKATYDGAFYNSHAVNTEKLCPTGWHVPTDYEWLVLEEYIYANGYEKSNGALALKSTTDGGDDAFGFNGLERGICTESGSFGNVGTFGYWYSSNNGVARYVASAYNSINRSIYTQAGLNVRCIQGEPVECPAPTIIQSTSGDRCGEGTVQLSATSSAGELNWFTDSVGGNLIGSDSPWTTPSVDSTTTFFVEATYYSCVSSSRTPSLVTIKVPPTIDTTISAERCGEGTVTLEATASAGTINWYSSYSTGTLVGSGSPWTTPSISKTKYYYAEADDGICTSTSRETAKARIRCVTNPSTVDDIDGNTYATVQIGDQVWMAENLKTTKYNDGDSISYGLSSIPGAWASTSEGAMCYYDNDKATYETKYGALYNSHAVNTGKLCPSGWHVPTNYEWTLLENFLSDNEYSSSNHGTALTGFSEGGNDPFGFNGLEGGHIKDDGVFTNVTYHGYWYSSSEGQSREIKYNNGLLNNPTFTQAGLSVRCIQGPVTPCPAPTITSTTNDESCGGASGLRLEAIQSSGTISWYKDSVGGTSFNSNQFYYTPYLDSTTTYYVEAKDGCKSNSRTAVIATIHDEPKIISTVSAVRCGDGTVDLQATAERGTVHWTGYDTSGTGSPWTTPVVSQTTSYYVKAYDGTCFSSYGTRVSAQVTCLNNPSTVTDVDGNTYPTAVFGNLEWMTQNLRTTRYNDGDSITLIEMDPHAWKTNTTGAMCYYNWNKTVNDTIYGGYYNWYAVETAKLCPIGWHVPTMDEWDELEAFVDANGYQASTIALGLKSAAGDGHDPFGFTGQFGGFCNEGGSFGGRNSYGRWYSSSNKAAPYIYYGDNWFRSTTYTQAGLNVRCVKGGHPTKVGNYKEDNPVVSIYPNPVQENLTVELSKSMGTDDISITVLDAQSAVIYSQAATNLNQSIDVSKWSAGIYFVQVINGNEIVKVIKMVVDK